MVPDLAVSTLGSNLLSKVEECCLLSGASRIELNIPHFGFPNCHAPGKFYEKNGHIMRKMRCVKVLGQEGSMR